MSDKRLLERCGTANGYLIETRAIRSDLRVCSSREPKSEQKGPGPRPIPDVQQVDETGNVLSKTKSQGFQGNTGFGPTEPDKVQDPPGYLFL